MEKIMKVNGMSCNHCKAHVEKALDEVSGVKKAVVDLDKKEARITLEAPVENQVLMDAVKNAGYEPVSIQ